MKRSLSMVSWTLLIGRANSRSVEVDTTSMNTDLDRTTQDCFVQIEALAESLNQLTRDYIAVAQTDMQKMLEAGRRVVRMDAVDARMLSRGMDTRGPSPVR